MIIDSNRIISITEVNRNFSSATKLAKEKGEIVIFKMNKPKYLFVDLDESPQIEMTDEEKILFVGKRILKRYKDAFMELAKW